MVAATQYVQINLSYSYGINTQFSNVQLMAKDTGINSAGYLLTNTGGVYSVDLGDWMVGAKKSFTAAFAIVNEEQATALKLYKIDITGTTPLANYVYIYAHGNPAKLSHGSTAVAVDPVYEVVGADVDAWNAGDTTLRYVNAGVSNDFSSSAAIVLSPAPEPYAATMPYTFDDGTTVYDAAWAASNVWTQDALDPNGIATPASTAVAATSNVIWIEITIDTTGAADSQTTSADATINFYFQSVTA